MTRRIALLVGAAVLLIAGTAIPLLVFGYPAEKKAATCENGVSVYFESDAAMHAAATALEDDDRIGEVQTETRQQASRRLTRDVLERVPEADAAEVLGDSEPGRWLMPAVHVAADDTDPHALAEDLAGELSNVETARAATCDGDSSDPSTLLVDVPCGAEFSVFFDTDKEMNAAAEALADDERVSVTETRTKAEAYAVAVKVFADQPEMRELVSPDELPASVQVSVAEGDPDVLSKELEADLSGVVRTVKSSCYGIAHPVVAS